MPALSLKGWIERNSSQASAEASQIEGLELILQKVVIGSSLQEMVNPTKRLFALCSGALKKFKKDCVDTVTSEIDCQPCNLSQQK